jgi:hypothetical protein
MTETNRFPYVIVRYHYDPVRDEALNIGVVLQGSNGLLFKVIEDWDAMCKAYPFLDSNDLKRKTEALSQSLRQSKFVIFDYDLKERSEFGATDSGLLQHLGRTTDRSIELTAPRYGETSGEGESQYRASLEYLFTTLVEPPRPHPAPKQLVERAEPRQTHAGMHGRAKRAIVRAAKKVGLSQNFELDPAIKGKTRTWHLDLKIGRELQFIHHILVLPDLEETYLETAALARVWQDVQHAHDNVNLAAVYFSKNGTPKAELRAAERLLRQDKIQPLYADELEQYYREVVGQRRLVNRSE